MRHLLTSCCLLTAFALPVQAQVKTDWVSYPGGVAVALNGAGDIYTANWAYEPGGDIWLTKRDRLGAVIWEASSGNVDNNRHEVATWVGTDRQGRILVSGTVRSGYANPVDAHGVLMQFSPQGQLLWRRELGADFDGSSTRKLLLDAQDNVVVLGLGQSAHGLTTQVRKIAPDGSDVWTFVDAAGIGAPVNMKATPDQGWIVVARSITGIVNGYAKLDSAGQLLWWTSGVNSTPMGDAAGDATGNTYLVNAGTELRKLSPQGTPVWSRQHTMTATRVEVGNDGNPLLGGFPPGGGAGAAFMKYGASGDVLWQQPDGDGPGQNLLLHGQMLLDRYDNAYLAGSTLGTMAVTKVRADGSAAWTAVTSGSYAAALALGKDLSVHVAGGQTAKLSQTLADLALSLADSPDPARVGQPLTLTLSARNRGPVAAEGTTLVYPLPAQVDFIGATPSQGSCVIESGSLVCALGALGTTGPAAQAQVAVTLVPHHRGTLRHQANLQSATEDPALTNNSASASTRIKR